MPSQILHPTLLLLAWMTLGLVTPSTAAEPTASPAPVASPALQSVRPCSIGTVFARTELFFGRSRSGDAVVTDAEWRGFLEQEITPRFPAGLTVLRGMGQFTGQSGIINREEAVLVILLYPVDTAGSHEHIEAIREAYKRTFQQQSVLRVDTTACTSF